MEETTVNFLKIKENKIMKKILLIFSILQLVVFHVLGQKSVLYYEVQQTKKSNIYFENAALATVNSESEILKHFINPNEVFFFGNMSLDLRNNDIKAMNLLMPTGNKNIILELVEVPEYFYDYTVTTASGESFPANRDIKHYHGVVSGEKNSVVAISFYEDEIMGIVCTDEGNFNIAKDKQSGKHIFYNDQNLKEKGNISCGTDDNDEVVYDPEVLLKERIVLNESELIIN